MINAFAQRRAHLAFNLLALLPGAASISPTASMIYYEDGIQSDPHEGGPRRMGYDYYPHSHYPSGYDTYPHSHYPGGYGDDGHNPHSHYPGGYGDDGHNPHAHNPHSHNPPSTSPPSLDMDITLQYYADPHCLGDLDGPPCRVCKDTSASYACVQACSYFQKSWAPQSCDQVEIGVCDEDLADAFSVTSCSPRAPPPPLSHGPHSHDPHSHDPHSHDPHSHNPTLSITPDPDDYGSVDVITAGAHTTGSAEHVERASTRNTRVSVFDKSMQSFDLSSHCCANIYGHSLVHCPILQAAQMGPHPSSESPSASVSEYFLPSF